MNSDFGVITIHESLAAYFLQVVDPTSDEVLTTVSAGQTVYLVLFAQVTTELGQGFDGVFSAYADIGFDPDSVTIAGAISHSDIYEEVTFGQIEADRIQEAGGILGDEGIIGGVGLEPVEVLRIPFVVENVGAGTEIVFDSIPADAGPIRATTVLGFGVEVPAENQTHVGTSVTVV